MGGVLKQNGKCEFDGKMLSIKLPYESSFIVTMLSDAQNKKIVSELIERSFGKLVPYKFDFDNIDAKPQSSNSPAMRKEIENEPAIKKAIELFNGKIVDVQKVELSEER